MTKYDLPVIGEGAQYVPQPTFPLGRDHAVSWAEYIQSKLAETQRKRALPQTRDDHAKLADREERYARQLARFKAAGVLS